LPSVNLAEFVHDGIHFVNVFIRREQEKNDLIAAYSTKRRTGMAIELNIPAGEQESFHEVEMHALAMQARAWSGLHTLGNQLTLAGYDATKVFGLFSLLQSGQWSEFVRQWPETQAALQQLAVRLKTGADAQVVLRGPNEGPLVAGKTKGTLTTPQYNVVKALLDAGEAGLTKDELDRKSRHGDARKILKRLADSDPDWQAVLSFPGTTGKRYRLT
jgi:hypothetical protein